MRAVYWNLTDRCNLRCRHCYLHDELTSPSEHPPHELNTHDCLKIVDQCDEARAFYVNLLGGELFCRSDIMVILRYLGEKRFWTKITTNGTLITENIARDLADIGLKGMFLSLEGPSPETNDVIRGKGAFEKTIKGISYIRDYGIPFDIQVTIFNTNCDKIEQIADFCSNLTAERVVFESFNYFSSTQQSFSLIPNREETFAAARKIRELKTTYPKGFISSSADAALRFLSSDPDSGAKGKKLVRCDLGSTQIGILSNGDVIPCIYMRDQILGNLMETRLSEIPHLPGFKEFKDLREVTIDEANEQCSVCEWRYICGGGCRGRAYLRYGDLLSPDPYMCFLAGKSGIWGR